MVCRSTDGLFKKLSGGKRRRKQDNGAKKRKILEIAGEVQIGRDMCLGHAKLHYDFHPTHLSYR